MNATKEQIEQARELYCAHTYDVEVDDSAKVSVADDGVWVAAWVWLANPETEGDE